MSSLCSFRFPFFRVYAAGVAALVLLLNLAVPHAEAREAKDAPTTKTALVLLTFGTTYDQASDPLDPVRREISARHPDMPVYVAYSSAHVLNTLRAKGLPAKNLPQVLADLSAEGFTHIAVQSMHVVPGLEFDIAKDIISRFQAMPKGDTAITLGVPLVASHEDAERVAGLLFASLPAERGAKDAVVFVGHGAVTQNGSLAYPALQCFLAGLDRRLFVGTIEGPFTLENTLTKVDAAKVERMWLIPLLTVVGDHAQNDLFGDDDGSWKQAFIKAGIPVVMSKRGLTAVPGLAAVWADHADAALKELE